MSDAVNISSLVLGVSPDHVVETRSALEALAGVEVHAIDGDGRMVVTVEASSEDFCVQQFEAIRQTPGVLSASLVYHQHETDPDEEA